MSKSEKRRLSQAGAGVLSAEDPTATEKRLVAYVREMGGGLRDIAIGNELDSILKWADQVNQGREAFDALEIDAGLKAALAPLFNLPSDLVEIISIWKSIKDRFPKE